MVRIPSSGHRSRGRWAKKGSGVGVGDLAKPRRPVIVEWRDAFADRADEAHIEEQPIIKSSMGWLRNVDARAMTLIHEYDEGKADIFYTTIPAELVVSVTYLQEEES